MLDEGTVVLDKWTVMVGVSWTTQPVAWAKRARKSGKGYTFDSICYYVNHSTISAFIRKMFFFYPRWFQTQSQTALFPLISVVLQTLVRMKST